MDGDKVMRKKGLSAFWQRKQYVIAGALLVAAAVGMTALYSNRQADERENLEQKMAQEMQEEQSADLVAEEIEETEEAELASSIVVPQETPVPHAAEIAAEDGNEENGQDEETGEPEETKDVQNVAQSLHFAPEDGILWPMEGNVIINYSMDSTVYFATLDQYKYNPAIIIAGDVNSKVYSVAKGKVSGIENNEVTGTTMTVDLGDGYEAIYGQLKELNFDVGDYVEAGHVLGYIGEPTKYYAVEGSNLYFELKKDGAPVDPIEFFE